VETQKEFRYPHCVVDEKFHLMTVVSQGCLICKKLTALFFRTTRIKCPPSQESMQIVPPSASEVTGLFLSHVYGQSN